MKTVLTIGIAGPSGSGKSLFAKRLIEKNSRYDIILLHEDSYYHDLSDIPFDIRTGKNFDHPQAFDHLRLIKDLSALKNYEEVFQPIYDYKTHTRIKKTKHLKPQHILIVEGILLFSEPGLVDLLDIKLFMDIDPDICFIRRLKRDINERGRDLDSVINQYIKTVKPMLSRFIIPSKKHADLIIPEGGKNMNALEIISSRIHEHIET